METKTVIVTGGAGFVGSTFADRMLERGHNVIVFDSFVRPGVEYNTERLEGAHIIRGDIRKDLEKIKGESKISSADWILHAAANPGIKWSIDYPEFDFETNAVGTGKVLRLAYDLNAAVVYTSTNKVFDGTKINAIPLKEEETRYVYADENFKGINEDFPIDGPDHSLYGVSKLSGDLLCQEYAYNMGVPTVVNRCSCMGGAYQIGVEDQGWFSWFALAAYSNQRLNIYGNGKQVRDTLDGDDVARLFEIEFQRMDDLSGNVFTVGGGRKNTMSLLECIDYLNKKLDTDIPTEYRNWRVADQKVYISDITKVTTETGWTPRTSPQQLLDKICVWIEENPEIVNFYTHKLPKMYQPKRC